MNGVSTEDRFQKMTNAQWIMHSIMIDMEEREKWNLDKEIIKSVIEVVTTNIQHIVKEATDKVAMISSPKVYQKYLELLENEKNPGGKEKELEDLEATFKNLISSGAAPASITLEMEDRGHTVNLPKRPRSSLGIQKQKE